MRGLEWTSSLLINQHAMVRVRKKRNPYQEPHSPPLKISNSFHALARLPDTGMGNPCRHLQNSDK